MVYKEPDFRQVLTYTCPYLEWDSKEQKYTCPYKKSEPRIFEDYKPIRMNLMSNACPGKEENGHKICYIIKNLGGA
jgi:hypothetical protein